MGTGQIYLIMIFGKHEAMLGYSKIEKLLRTRLIYRITVATLPCSPTSGQIR